MHYHFFAVFVGIYTVVGGRKCENFYIFRHQCEVFFIRRYAQKIMGHPVERYKEVLHGGGGRREGWISIFLFEISWHCRNLVCG